MRGLLAFFFLSPLPPWTKSIAPQAIKVWRYPTTVARVPSGTTRDKVADIQIKLPHYRRHPLLLPLLNAKPTASELGTCSSPFLPGVGEGGSLQPGSRTLTQSPTSSCTTSSPWSAICSQIIWLEGQCISGVSHPLSLPRLNYSP